MALDATHYVVLHDLVSFRDPADAGGIPRSQYHWLYARYGERLPAGVSDAEINEGVTLGAIADQGAPHAQRALAGMPQDKAASAPGIPLREGKLPNLAEGVSEPQVAVDADAEQSKTQRRSAS